MEPETCEPETTVDRPGSAVAREWLSEIFKGLLIVVVCLWGLFWLFECLSDPFGRTAFIGYGVGLVGAAAVSRFQKRRANPSRSSCRHGIHED
jgi:hypothetical protein